MGNRCAAKCDDLLNCFKNKDDDDEELLSLCA
jgi:hypothetical protein